MEKRFFEIMEEMKSFEKELFNKRDVLPELLLLQKEMVSLTFKNGENAEKLRIWDVEARLDEMNSSCGHVADEQLLRFKEKCKSVCNMIKAEMSGLSGEKRTFKCLETLHCRNKLLKNVEFTLDEHRTELDAIVVTEKAAFIIEIKNPSKDIYIDERGNYCRVSNGKCVFDKNIGEKMNEKEYLLRAAFETAGITGVNIISFVVFTDSAVRVVNRFPHIVTCYLSELPYRIKDYDGDSIYTATDIEKMVVAIDRSKCHESYPMSMDMQRFKTDFAALLALLEVELTQRGQAGESASSQVPVMGDIEQADNPIAWIKKNMIVTVPAFVKAAAFSPFAATTRMR